MTKYTVVLVTCPSKKEARRIVRRLLERKFIACASIINGVESIFRWKGKIEKSMESLIVMKTAKKRLKDVEETVKSMHSYEVPEIAALPLVWASGDYLKWLGDSVEMVSLYKEV